MVALYVVSGLLVAFLAFSAALKLSGRPDVVASYEKVGVPPRRLPLLAAVILAGGLGVAAGLVWTPIGVAAAGCLTCYFVLALLVHARHRDLAHAGPPLVLLALSAAATALFVVVA